MTRPSWPPGSDRSSWRKGIWPNSELGCLPPLCSPLSPTSPHSPGWSVKESLHQERGTQCWCSARGLQGLLAAWITSHRTSPGTNPGSVFSLILSVSLSLFFSANSSCDNKLQVHLFLNKSSGNCFLYGKPLDAFFHIALSSCVW